MIMGVSDVRATDDRPAVRVEDRGPVRILRINRPESRNAFSGEVITGLFRAMVEADADPDVWAVVLTGVDPAFCAGVDLKQAAAEGAAYFQRHRVEPVIRQAARMRTPIIGAINGPCFTGGLELALGCDFLIASERAVFADTHARVGVRPRGGMTARLPSYVGMAWARRLSFANEVVDAERALRLGLVTEVVPHDQLLEHAVGLATAIAKSPPDVMQAIKRMYVGGSGLAMEEAARVEEEIADAGTPPYDELFDRLRAVTTSNQSQIGDAT